MHGVKDKKIDYGQHFRKLRVKAVEMPFIKYYGRSNDRLKIGRLRRNQRESNLTRHYYFPRLGTVRVISCEIESKVFMNS